jgi:anthranilate synthase/aminodeoxychorismate synthase-like glutamine amidotransferase
MARQPPSDPHRKLTRCEVGRPAFQQRLPIDRKSATAQCAAMILLIDNYDSFTWNLVQFLGDLGAACDVRRNDALGVAEALALQPAAIVLSPGPCTPNEAGICLDLIRAASGTVPILGVCLGHQAIGQAFGGQVVRAPVPMHGKISPMQHLGTDLFAGLPSPFPATRYHSLVVDRPSLPDTLVETAWTDEVAADGSPRRLIMGLRHRSAPIWGVQFHPESIASAHGHEILANFLAMAGCATTARAA